MAKLQDEVGRGQRQKRLDLLEEQSALVGRGVELARAGAVVDAVYFLGPTAEPLVDVLASACGNLAGATSALAREVVFGALARAEAVRIFSAANGVTADELRRVLPKERGAHLAVRTPTGVTTLIVSQEHLQRSLVPA